MFHFIEIFIAMLKNMFTIIAICRIHIIYRSHFIYSSENKMSGPRVHTRNFLSFFRTKRMMWKKIDTLFSLGQWTGIKMKLSIFQCSTFLPRLRLWQYFPVFFRVLFFFIFIIYCMKQLFNLEQNIPTSEHRKTDNIQSCICRCENKHFHLLENDVNRTWNIYLST